jgi:hypothetical protein
MIFLDWALEAAQIDMRDKLQSLIDEYGNANPDHPMTSVILEGMKKSSQSGRRGGSSGRR